jgi:hypothetical protein
MQAFLQHVGHQNFHHIEETVTSLRTIEELLSHIPPSAPERCSSKTVVNCATLFQMAALIAGG